MCGDRNHKHLIFHHLNPNEKEIAVAKMKYNSLNNVKKEIDKCVTLCRNCHFKLHHIQKPRKRRENGALKLNREYKELIGCNICGERHGSCLQYHHINANEKYKDVSAIHNIKECIIEMEKCIILCANCHSELQKIK